MIVILTKDVKGTGKAGEVVKVSLSYQRHQRKTGIVANMMLFKILHDSICCSQTVCAASGQNNSMNFPRCHQWVEQLALSGSGAAASHIKSRVHPSFRDQHCTAGTGFTVFKLPDFERAYICN